MTSSYPTSAAEARHRERARARYVPVRVSACPNQPARSRKPHQPASVRIGARFYCPACAEVLLVQW